MFKTFMHGHICLVTFLHLETRDANFLLIQFSELSVGLVSPSPILGSISTFKTFLHGHLCGDLSVLRIQRCEFSIDSVFQTFHWFSFPCHPS